LHPAKSRSISILSLPQIIPASKKLAWKFYGPFTILSLGLLSELPVTCFPITSASSLSSPSALSSNCLINSASPSCTMATDSATFATSSKSKTESKARLLDDAFVIAPVGEHKATIIWLHGLGDSYEGFSDMFTMLNLKNIRVVIPNASIRPVTLNNGMKMRAWYDILRINRSGPPNQDEKSILQSAELITELLEFEATKISSDMIILGGFSQGAAMSIHVGLKYHRKLGGIIACSGYVLNHDKYTTGTTLIHKANIQTPLFAYHGSDDNMMQPLLAKGSYDLLSKAGVKIEYNEEKNLGHSMSNYEIQKLIEWLHKKLNLKNPQSKL